LIAGCSRFNRLDVGELRQLEARPRGQNRRAGRRRVCASRYLDKFRFYDDSARNAGLIREKLSILDFAEKPDARAGWFPAGGFRAQRNETGVFGHRMDERCHFRVLQFQLRRAIGRGEWAGPFVRPAQPAAAAPERGTLSA
jgi:hypothetical protein